MKTSESEFARHKSNPEAVAPPKKAGQRSRGASSTAAEVYAVAQELERTGRLGVARAHTQHGTTSVYDHVVSVALVSARMADRLERMGFAVDRASLIRGALLHDYFLYDWHDLRALDRIKGYTHPFIALGHASEDFELTKRERNIISRHMFPLVPLPPTCREAWIVTMADKYCAAAETVAPRVGRFIEMMSRATRR